MRKDNAPANLACMRRIPLTQLKQEKSKKLGIQGKRRRAGWDSAYLELEDNLDFELRHQSIINHFSRYPHRNSILARSSNATKLAFLSEPGSSL